MVWAKLDKSNFLRSCTATFGFVTKKLLYLRTNFSLQFLLLLSAKVSEHSNNLVGFQNEKTNEILNNVERHHSIFGNISYEGPGIILG